MGNWWRRWWKTLLKAGLALAILVFVGRQFYRDLQRPELAELTWRPGWLALSALCYLAGLGFSWWFWQRLLNHCGARPTLFTSFRAYYIGHLGKYVPGKAWALLLRGTLVQGPCVRLGTAILTAFYEVLTTMAAGALIAAVVFALEPPRVADLAWPPWLTGVLLLGLIGVPLLPMVFNFLVARLAAKLPSVQALDLPRLRLSTLLEGLGLTLLGWGLLGLGLWAMLQAALPDPPPLTAAIWLQVTAALALSYVAGFLALVMPGGVGVREFFLLQLLAWAGPQGLIAVAVLLTRLTWTAGELLLAAALVPWKNKTPDRIASGGVG